MKTLVSALILSASFIGAAQASWTIRPRWTRIAA